MGLFTCCLTGLHHHYFYPLEVEQFKKTRTDLGIGSTTFYSLTFVTKLFLYLSFFTRLALS